MTKQIKAFQLHDSETEEILGAVFIDSEGSTQEDEIDSHINFLINGPKKRVIRQDGVPKADIARSFPYINAPKPDSFLGAK